MMWKILPFFVAIFVVGLGSSPPEGIRDINPRDLGFQRALQYAISEYNSNSQEEHIYALDKVIKAQIQMEGERMKYTMTVKLGKTFCPKYRHTELDRHTGFCPIIQNPRFTKYIICKFKVLKQHHGMKLLHSECKKINPWD